MKHFEKIEGNAIGAQKASTSDFPRMSYPASGKRLLDITLSLMAAPLAIMMILMVAVVMRLSNDKGPVLFAHKRIGRNGKVFRCWKIRSMVTDSEKKLYEHLRNNPEAAEEWKRDQKLTHDPRITKLGRILRKTSLDELPQLWNVLKGEMSLVGPRPIVRTEIQKYGQHRFSYFSVKPGLTGLWQVSGRNDISYGERVLLDAEYARNVSFLLDLKIITSTIGVVLNRSGK